MNKNLYRQTDSRWGSLPYPTKASSFSGNGCGACSVLHCIIEQEKYKNWTPKDIQPYMKQFAVSGQGTLWSGIATALKYYGMKNVKWFKQDAKMSDIFAECNKKNRLGVILFSSVYGPDGTLWTSSGHYIAFIKYKYENGKHWFYLKDSGGRKHDGWYCYENSMKGAVPQVWTCTLPSSVEKEPEKKMTTYRKDMVAYAKTLCHPLGTAKSKWEYDKGAPVAKFKTECKKYMDKTSRIALSDCGNFLDTVIRAKGPDKDAKILAGAKEPFPKLDGFKVVWSGKKIPDSEIKEGRIVRYKKTDGGQHALMLISKGVVAEAGRAIRFPVIHKSEKYNGSSVKFSTLEVFEPIEKEVKA